MEKTAEERIPARAYPTKALKKKLNLLYSISTVTDNNNVGTLLEFLNVPATYVYAEITLLSLGIELVRRLLTTYENQPTDYRIILDDFSHDERGAFIAAAVNRELKNFVPTPLNLQPYLVYFPSRHVQLWWRMR